MVADILYALIMMYIGVGLVGFVFDKSASKKERIVAAVFLFLVAFVFFMLMNVVTQEQLEDFLRNWRT